MPRRYHVPLLAGAVILAVLLLLPSFTVRAIAAALLLLVIALLILKALLTKTSQDNYPAQNINADNTHELQESFALGKLFEATMNGMREGLLVVDREMRVVASNTAAHRLFSPSQKKLNAQRLTELTRNPAIYSAFLDALQGTERSGVKVEMHGPDRLVFDLRVVPLAAFNGKIATPQGALGVFIDVTRLELLEQMRQEFLSNVSHELRTPLTAILAFIETLEAGAIDDKEASQRFLSIIRRNTLRMNELIEDILELSAIETGNVQVRAEPAELAPVVSDVISSLAAKAADKQVVVSNEVDRRATVFADPRRLEQMLTNLVENAIKFNREQGRVKIRFESAGSSPTVSKGGWDSSPTPGPPTGQPGWGGTVREGAVSKDQSETVRDKIIVEDSGEGIPAQHLDRLFERFYRVDRARSREEGGMGLGLAIVKHLARAHDGEVTVTSEVGKGSTFIIELPKLHE